MKTYATQSNLKYKDRKSGEKYEFLLETKFKKEVGDEK